MKTLGIIGYPLDHSFSPHFFKEKIKKENIQDVEYLLFPLSSIELFLQLLKNKPSLKGVNVTHPYKKQIINYLDEIDSVAVKTGAVNVVKITPKGYKKKLTGYNTDVIGFDTMMKESIQTINRSALIIGTGGAANAAKYVLDNLNITSTMVSRTSNAEYITYQSLTPEIIKNNLLIINATPLGMHPLTEYKPNIPYQAITPDHLIIDLIYNPITTRFMQECQKYGATVKNGWKMFQKQAEESWKIWMM